MTTIELRRFVTAADKTANPYLELPFAVPAGVRRLEVAYQYAGRREGRAQIDLGLVDPRGNDFPAFPGFRGWSGSFRDFAVITDGSATPGFVPGPIPPGNWHVLLGLSRVPDEGALVEVEIALLERPGEPPHRAPRRASAPAPRGPGWFRGDLHSHTHHSDAPGSIDHLVAEARAAGLDFLAVTDHNTISHLPYLAASPPDLLLVPGVEVTNYDGHLNVWGVTEAIDWRRQRPSDMAAVIEAAHSRGWVCSPCHPIAPGMEWQFGYDLSLDCLEVWHGPSGAFNVLTLRAWEELLQAGRRVVAVGGSDHHSGKEYWLARPTVWVRAEDLTVPSLVDGLRAGHVVITEHDGPWIELEVERDGRIYGPGDSAPAGRVQVRCRCERAEGLRCRLVTALGEIAPGELDLTRHRYVRAELRYPGDDPFPLAALTNPVWVNHRRQPETGMPARDKGKGLPSQEAARQWTK